ncbi:MAG: hypothetical protein GKR89_35175 [Candidatus Latescibacteria bacterium]|nr:hypothetical protein [Candidatus Latescibacterota bacterium]
MTFSDDQIEHFRSQGYIALPNFYSHREMVALQAEVERFKGEGLVRNVATEGDGKTHSSTVANLQLIPLFDKSDLIRALPFDDKVLQAVGQLIGAPFLLHLDQMFLKPAGHGMGTSWHQDNAYFKIADPLRGTAMWIAIHDATLDNGTLHLIPGSHREQYEHSRDANSDHHIRAYPPEERAVPIELQAGGVAFFCYGTAHCTRANTTDRERAGMAFHFLHTDYADAQLTEDDRRARPLLTGPRATGGQREYGVDVSGTWEKEVTRVLDRDQVD